MRYFWLQMDEYWATSSCHKSAELYALPRQNMQEEDGRVIFHGASHQARIGRRASCERLRVACRPSSVSVVDDDARMAGHDQIRLKKPHASEEPFTSLNTYRDHILETFR